MLGGEIPTCAYVQQAVRRFHRDLERAASGWEFRFEPKAARHFFEYCETELKQFEGVFAGKPLKLQPWQKFVFGNIFGWLKIAKLEGKSVRRFREAIIEIPKKQGKSILGAAIALYLIEWDDVPGAQVYGLAKNRSHAEKLSYRAARAMSRKNPRMIEELRVNESAANIGIYNDAIDSYFAPLTSKPDSTDGLNVHGAINDETKDWDDFDIYNIIKDGTVSMYNSLILNITTAGHDKKSLGYERRSYLLKLLDQTLTDESTFGIVYTIDKHDLERWDEPHVWAKAMPNFGVSVLADAIATKIPSCRASSSQKNSFLTKHLNVWLSAENAFIPSEKWKACSTSVIPAIAQDAVAQALAEYRGCRAFAGLDMGSVDDFTSLVVVVDNPRTGARDVIPFFWIPEDSIVERKNKHLISEWVEQGWIYTTPGDYTDHNFTQEVIKTVCRELNVVELAYDRYKMDMMVANLVDEGIEMTPFGQGYVSMNPAVDELEKSILGKRLNLGHNPVLEWMNSNVVVMTDPAMNRKFAKDKAQDKIDGIVCLAMAEARRIASGEDPGNAYDHRGVLGFTIKF